MSSLRELGRAELVRLANALDTGKLRAPYCPSRIGQYVSTKVVPSAIAELKRLDGDGFHPQHIIFTLRMLAEERAAAQAIRDRVDIVWTGPEVISSGSRDSATVARELLGQATHSVLLASYALDPNEGKLKGVLGLLAERMEMLPDLDVQLFVNVPRRWKDHRSEEAILNEFATQLRNRWPGERMPAVYYDPRALEDTIGSRACLHAKVIVVDHHKALVTSANLTEAAHERNIEAGLLIDDPDVAKTLERQFQTLVSTGALVKVPC